MTAPTRDHGGALDAAIRRWGGTQADWLDLSTGINPVPWPAPRPVPQIPAADWTRLPDRDATARAEAAARRLWRVPDQAAVLAAPGTSALIARIPALQPPSRVRIAPRTYNEHAAAFTAHGWQVVHDGPAPARVVVHPNNPDGALWNGDEAEGTDLLVIDESFCDTLPGRSHVALAARPGVVVLKSFGKFWGLAGLRLGFAIGRPETLERLAVMLGPWPVSGPALRIGAAALADGAWIAQTRQRLQADAARLDRLMAPLAARVGGTPLFRLYRLDRAAALHRHLAERRILSRIFPYDGTWLRLGLPGDAAGWARLEEALAAWS